MATAKLRYSEAGSETPTARDGRESVLAAALEAFAAQGFHGTSMRDIAARADMSISAAYYYFPSKADLLRHIMVSVAEDLIAILEAARDTADDMPAARLAAIVRAYVRLHTERQTESFIGTSELRSLSTEDRASVVALHDRVSDIFKNVIGAGCRSGQFDCPHPAEATRAIATMCTAVAGWYRASGTHSPQTIADRYAALALRLVGCAEECR